MQVTRYSDVIIQAQRTHGGIMHQSLHFNLDLYPVFVVTVLLNNEQIFGHFFQTVALAIHNFMKL